MKKSSNKFPITYHCKRIALGILLAAGLFTIFCLGVLSLAPENIQITPSLSLIISLILVFVLCLWFGLAIAYDPKSFWEVLND